MQFLEYTFQFDKIFDIWLDIKKVFQTIHLEIKYPMNLYQIIFL